MNWQHHKYLWACMAIMSSLLALQSAAQSLSRIPPEKVTQISASLDKSLLPKGTTNFEVERNQVVAAPGITFVPVHFRADSMNGDSPILEGQMPQRSYCGLYQLADGAPARFLLSLGTGETDALECSGLNAIGAAAPHAAHGNLILIYGAYTPHTNLSEPVILSWDDAQRQYVINADLSNFVRENGETGNTIFKIRNLLAPRAAKP